MRYRLTPSIVALAAALIIAAVQAPAAAQSKPAEKTFANTWLPTPRGQSQKQQAEAAARIKGHAFNLRDLTGVWGIHGAGVGLSNPAPAMTPWGQARYNAAKPGMGPRAVPLGNDPMMICDPIGQPRWLGYNYGMEFIQLPDRVVQFFEAYHTYRTIWTDGRVLPTPEDDAEPRYQGYSVGHWEGDTFIVESTGFDDRSWLDTQGYPHSDQMRVVERYQRASYDTLKLTYTIDDPMTYTKPWVSSGTIRLAAGTEIGEYFCVPSQEEEYRRLVRAPAGGETKK
jgi:hypothetical protein